MDTSVFQAFKLAVVTATGLSKGALHVYVGLIVWLAATATLRRSVRSLLPLGVVLAVAIVGEAWDARDDIATLGHWRIGASAHDVVNTLFWPTVLVLVARFARPLER
jgi:hypothetical protein